MWRAFDSSGELWRGAVTQLLAGSRNNCFLFVASLLWMMLFGIKGGYLFASLRRVSYMLLIWRALEKSGELCKALETFVELWRGPAKSGELSSGVRLLIKP